MTSFQFLKLEPAEHLQFLWLREDILLKAYYLGSTVLSTLYLAFDPRKEIRLNAPSLTDAKGQDQYWVQASRLLYTYFDPLCNVSFQMQLVTESFLYMLAYSSWAHRVSTMAQVLWETFDRLLHLSESFQTRKCLWVYYFGLFPLIDTKTKPKTMLYHLLGKSVI